MAIAHGHGGRHKTTGTACLPPFSLQLFPGDPTLSESYHSFPPLPHIYTEMGAIFALGYQTGPTVLHLDYP